MWNLFFKNAVSNSIGTSRECAVVNGTHVLAVHLCMYQCY